MCALHKCLAEGFNIISGQPFVYETLCCEDYIDCAI
jgi:hypothetical protein